MSFSRIVEIFTLLIAATFIALGIFVLASSSLAYIPLNYRLVFACVLIAYGSFRIIVICLNIIRNNESNEEE